MEVDGKGGKKLITQDESTGITNEPSPQVVTMIESYLTYKLLMDII